MMDTPHFSHHMLFSVHSDVSSCQRHTSVSTCRDTRKMANGRAQTSGCHRSPTLGTPIKRRFAQEHRANSTSKPHASTQSTQTTALSSWVGSDAFKRVFMVHTKRMISHARAGWLRLSSPYLSTPSVPLSALGSDVGTRLLRQAGIEVDHMRTL
jgi:hypothetical protein